MRLAVTSCMAQCYPDGSGIEGTPAIGKVERNRLRSHLAPLALNRMRPLRQKFPTTYEKMPGTNNVKIGLVLSNQLDAVDLR
jgi:hypothetical protein